MNKAGIDSPHLMNIASVIEKIGISGVYRHMAFRFAMNPMHWAENEEERTLDDIPELEKDCITLDGDSAIALVFSDEKFT